jgi:hypothetical protein
VDSAPLTELLQDRLLGAAKHCQAAPSPCRLRPCNSGDVYALYAVDCYTTIQLSVLPTAVLYSQAMSLAC